FCYKNRISDEKIEQAVSRLINSGTRDISIEKIKALLGNKQEYAREIADTQTTSMAKKQLAQAMKLIN
ncbi:MAG: hypothetical protein ACOCUL_05235, partial [Bacteroidota bacterium]